MFNDKLVFDDEPIYPSSSSSLSQAELWFDEAQLHKYIF